MLKHYKESSAWNALYSWHTEDTQQVLGIIIFSFKGICNFIYILFPLSATFGETIQKLAPKIIHAIKTNILAQYMYTECQNQSKQIFFMDHNTCKWYNNLSKNASLHILHISSYIKCKRKNFKYW